MNIVYSFTLAFFLVSCADDPYPGRTLIDPFDPATVDICEGYVDPLAETCSTECDLTQNHVADRDERLKLEEELEESLANIDEEDRQFKLDNFAAAKDICVPGVLTARPDEAVFINSDFCSCNNKKSEIINLGCEHKCAATIEGPTLFASVAVDQRISENPEMENLQGWCNNELTNDPANGVSPSCVFEVSDGVSTQDLNLATISGNSFTVNLNSLVKYRTYTGRLVEKGTNTTDPASSSIQIYRRDPQDGLTPFPGVLKLSPISQYTCITRVGAFDPQSRTSFYDNSARLHFYYNDREMPTVRPPDPNLFCHDIENLGYIDRPTYPRLELIPQAFSLWDTTDIRFSDVNQDSRMDINEIIETQIIRQFNTTPPTVDYFVPFQWPNAPQSEEESTVPTLGYMMRVFVDPKTGRGKCPTQEDYQGVDPSFIVLGQYVGVDTEALYIAFRQKINLVEEDGSTTEAPDDVLLIRQSLLEQIWWYQEGNLQVEPDEVTAGQRTLYFYYPPDPVHPYIKKSYQELYTVRDRSALSTGADAGETTGGLPSYDKRFGCVPANVSPEYESD
ncbi:MAG: hypothetical protein DRQ88_00125 [Epsilonproteobacteria bacterium]|nr:MAG: hypothetical protein DRQ89_10630 [Campylobacterota bacterium]RLA68042.1 MAG: hypothetical protein DRQ88_00125 [Campylobacterota bacterium]